MSGLQLSVLLAFLSCQQPKLVASRTITADFLTGDLSLMQILVATIAFLLPSAEYSMVEADKKVSSTSAKLASSFKLSDK